MDGTRTDTGVILCNCGGRLFTSAEMDALVERLALGAEEKEILAEENLCAKGALFALGKKIRKLGLHKLLFAGCSLQRHPELLQKIAAKTGLTPGAIYEVNLKAPLYRSPGKVDQAARTILRGLDAQSLIPVFPVEEVELLRQVVILGAGEPAAAAAAEVAALGYPTTLVTEAEGPERTVKGVAVVAGSRLLGVAGQVGSFELSLATPEGRRRLACGAIILAGDAGGKKLPAGGLPDTPAVAPLALLPGRVAALRRTRGTRSIGIVLDHTFEEGRGSTEAALSLALELQDAARRQVYLFCRDVRVASLPLEELYQRAREAGVVVVKTGGLLRLEKAGEQVRVTFREEHLGRELSLECDAVGVSPRGLSRAAPREIAALAGIHLDGLGQLQDNNIHLLPAATNRPGIFVVGPWRGEDYPPAVAVEARAAALAVHALLGAGAMRVERSEPVVDPDRCTLCLTCVRSCPFKAMRVDRLRGAASSAPEACQRCGICVGECPARAITLPVFSEPVLMRQLG